jgi:hypothetical protein
LPVVTVRQIGNRCITGDRNWGPGTIQGRTGTFEIYYASARSHSCFSDPEFRYRPRPNENCLFRIRWASSIPPLIVWNRLKRSLERWASLHIAAQYGERVMHGQLEITPSSLSRKIRRRLTSATEFSSIQINERSQICVACALTGRHSPRSTISVPQRLRSLANSTIARPRRSRRLLPVTT